MASPPCTAFSVPHKIFLDKQDEDDFQAKIEIAIKHMAFAVFIYTKQVAEGRMFALEHPASALLWQLAIMSELLLLERSERVSFDFFALGMEIEVEGVLKPAETRTSVVTNPPKFIRAFKEQQCKADCKHANTFGIKRCEISPEAFCELVCKAVMNEKSLSVRSGPARACCGCCWAFGDAMDITNEVNHSWTHSSPRAYFLR